MAHDGGKQVALGRVLVALSAVAWSTAGIFTKGVDADVWTVLLWRGLLAAGVMSGWLLFRQGRAGIADWKRLGWAGWSAATVSSAATICFIAAFKNTSVANVAIIYATAPFVAAAIAWVWMRETPGLAILAAAGLCVVGVTVMVGGSAGSPDLIGDFLALGMTALMALMMVLMRRFPDRPMILAVGPVSCLQLVAAAWVMGAQLDVTAREFVLMGGFGVAHATAAVLLAEGVLRIRAAEAALLGALEAPLAPTWSWLILSEIPSPTTVAGGAVVLVTLAWYLGRETRMSSLEPADARPVPEPSAKQREKKRCRTSQVEATAIQTRRSKRHDRSVFSTERKQRLANHVDHWRA